MYDDCHSLSQVPVHTDALIYTVLWFQQKLLKYIKVLNEFSKNLNNS